MNRLENYSCNEIIHNKLRDNDEYILCPFCNLQINENKPNKTINCCDRQKLINNDSVCITCGITFHNCEFVTPPVNFYENKFKFRKKTIYNRQYHIKNILNKYDLQQYLTWNERYKIYKIFEKIKAIQEKVNFNRKRLISINYILRHIFRMMKLKYRFISLPKQNKTIKFYKKWWKNVMKLIGVDIINIINKQVIF